MLEYIVGSFCDVSHFLQRVEGFLSSSLFYHVSAYELIR